MKKHKLTLLVLSVILAGCTSSSFETESNSSELPRQRAEVMFEFNQLPSTASETAEKAGAIVYGTVQAVETSSKNAIITTSVSFEVEEVLKGSIEPGTTIIVKTEDGAMRRSELRKGYTGALKEAADAHSQSGKLDTKLEDDALIVQLLPYGGLFTPDTKEVLCLAKIGTEEDKTYGITHGAYCRQIEVNEGELADLYDIKESMLDLGFEELEATDPSLIPQNLYEEIPITRNLEQIREMYDLE